MPNDRDVTGEHNAAPSMRTPRAPTGRLRALGGAAAALADLAPDDASRSMDLDAGEGEAIFELLVAVMWSDGELQSTEVERGRAAAEVMHVRSRRGGAFGAIAAGPLPFGDIGFDALSPRARRLAYAAAEWISDAADPSPRRSGFVRAVQLRLGIDDDEARWLAELALGLSRDGESSKAGFGALMESLLS
jgi:hypothetical protein